MLNLYELITRVGFTSQNRVTVNRTSANRINWLYTFNFTLGTNPQNYRFIAELLLSSVNRQRSLVPASRHNEKFDISSGSVLIKHDQGIRSIEVESLSEIVNILMALYFYQTRNPEDDTAFVLPPSLWIQNVGSEEIQNAEPGSGYNALPVTAKTFEHLVTSVMFHVYVPKDIVFPQNIIRGARNNIIRSLTNNQWMNLLRNNLQTNNIIHPLYIFETIQGRGIGNDPTDINISEELSLAHYLDTINSNTYLNLDF